MKKRNMKIIAILMCVILLGQLGILEVYADSINNTAPSFLGDSQVSANSMEQETLALGSDIITVTAEVQYGQTEARKMLEMLNDFRHEDGVWAWNEDNETKTYYTNLSSVFYDYKLEEIAMQRAVEIAFYYNHVRPDGTGFDSLYTGYRGKGEGIAAGYTTIEKVFEAWREEDEDYDGQCHRRIMLESSVRGVGIGHVIYNGVHYWTMEYGSPLSGYSEIEPNDSEEFVDVDIQSSSINSVSVTTDKNVYDINDEEGILLPDLNVKLNLNTVVQYEMYNNVPIVVNALWTVEDETIAQVRGDRVYGLQEGTTSLVTEILGQRVSVQLNVGNQEYRPANPVHNCTKLDDGSDTTTWSYVYFGSYPQSEVTDAATIAAIDSAITAGNGTTADAGTDVWVNGIKYRRISESDTNYSGYFDDVTNNGYRYFRWERIKWRVLQNDGNSLFVMADKALDCKDYNDIYVPTTWETSTLRSWLNDSFYQTAFSSAEQNAIITQTVVNEDNPYYDTEAGNNTTDNVYLLSLGEVMDESYGFCSADTTDSVSRRLQTSAYANARGAWRNTAENYKDNCWWWLRSPGPNSRYAADVSDYGDVGRSVTSVDYVFDGVAPALHINLSSDLWSLTDDGSSGEGGNTSNYIPTGKVENSGLLELDLKDLDIDVRGQGPLLDNKKFKLNFSKLKLEYGIEEDGTIKISGGTNKNVVRNKKEWEKLKNYIDAPQGATKINDSFQKNLVEQSDSQSLFSEDMKCSVALYAEGKVNEKGKFKCKAGGMKISFETPKLEYKQQFLVSGTIPVYLEGSLTIGGDLKAKVTIDDNRMGYSGNFAVEVPKIELSGAVGTKNVRGGAKGEVTNKLELVSNTNGKANTFTGTLEGTTELFLDVFFFEASTKLWEGKAQYYPELTYEVDSDLLFKPMKTYACEWQTVQSSSGNSFVFYNDIVGERTSGNQNGIFYNVKKGNTTISRHKLLDDDGTSDYVPISITSTAKNYAAGKAEDYVYVSWMNANREFTATEVESKNNITTIAKNCEICVAKIDGKTGELVKKYVIESTVDDKYDYLPSIAVTDQGIPFVAWAKNSADDPLTMCGTNEVFMAIYDSETDTFITQSVPVNSANWRQYPITNIEASYDGVAHKLLADVTFYCGEGGQKTKRMKSGSFLTQWSSVEADEVAEKTVSGNLVSRNTTDVIVDSWEETDLFELDSCMDIKKMQLGDKEVMTWYACDEGQAGSILYYDEDAKAVKTLVSSDNTVSSEYSIVNGENITLVLMTEAMNTDGTSNICAVEICDGKESAPFVLASVEGEVAYPNGAYDESTGKLTVSYYRYADEEWILENREVNEEGKLQIENITYPPLDVVPGAKVDFDVTVKNTGTADVSDYSVYIYEKSSDDASEEVLLASKSEINLARGANSTVSLSAVIPSDEGKKSALIVKVENVDAANVDEEYPITICYPDLELQSKSDEQSVVLLTENISNYDVEQVNLNVYATNKEGELLETKELGAVSAGEVIETVYTLENLEVYDCEDLYFEVFSDEEELMIVNNGCYVNIGEEEKKSFIGIVAEAGDSFSTMQVGASIDLDSVAVYAVYSDGTAEKVTGWTSNVSEIDMSTEGMKKLVITYQHGILNASYEIPFQVETDNLCNGNHSWDNGKVKVEESCEKNGEKIYTCKVCQTTRLEVIPMYDHKWGQGVVSQGATATKKGKKIYTCSECKATKTEDIPALGIPSINATMKSEDGKASYKVTKDASESSATGGTVTYIAPTDKNASIVTIPEIIKVDGITYKVTAISASAFKGNKKITKVTIGNNITSIPPSAFKGCPKLKTVQIGSNVTTISDNAFYKCSALAKITIPSNVKTIGKNAFYGCKKMTSATIGKSVSKIGAKAFYGCSKLKTLKIKSSKLTEKKIGSKAFSKTPKSMKVTIPKKKYKTYKSMLIKKGVNKKAKFKKG